jgi:hypothetical protein
LLNACRQTWFQSQFNSSWTGSDSLLKGARVLVVEDDFLILMELEAT